MSLLDLASLVLAPTATKEGKVYSAIPNTGDGDMTFSRGSAATRVNSAGLIEKERANRLLQSNNFNTSPYSPAFATVTSGFEGYDGSNDGWKVASTTIGSETRIRQSQTFTTGEVITLSVYMKKGNVNFGIVRNYAITGGGRAWFDLENGTVATENSGINGSIEDVGNGWYRCSIWGVINTTGAVDISPAPSDGDYLADAVGEFIYVQDSQLENGLVATDYIETTTTTAQAGILEDMPRLDYSGGATCGSLLLEPQRSNLLTQSEYFDTTPYSKVNATVTTNDITSPESVLNATKLISTGGASRVETFPTLSDNTNYTASIFAKQGDVDYIMISFREKSGNQHNVYFDLSDGTIGTTNGSPISKSIKLVGDYYKVSMTIDSSSGSGTPRLQYLIANTDNNVVTTSGQYIHIYGAMLEAGSYPTSYIPTYGSSVTRSADSCSKTGISSLIGQSEGTLFVDAKVTLNGRLLLIGAAGNFIETLINSSGKVNAFVRTSVTEADILSTSTYSTGDTLKIAFAYKQNDFALYVNGTAQGTDTSGNVPTNMSQLIINDYLSAGYNSSNGYKKAILFPTRLSNDELASLTTI